MWPPSSLPAHELPTLWPSKLDEHCLHTFEHRIIEIHDTRGYELVAACLVDGQVAAVGFKLVPADRPPFDVAFPDGSRRRFAMARASLCRLDERSDLWALGLSAALGVIPAGVSMCQQLDWDAVSLDGNLNALWQTPVRLKLSAMLTEEEGVDISLMIDLRTARFVLREKWNRYRPTLARALFGNPTAPISVA